MKNTIKIITFFILICFFLNATVFANNETILEEENKNGILVMKEESKTKLDEYVEKYESESYGLVAYILNLVRWYSIPVCFMGIVVGALNQYVLGTRRLDKKHKGYGLIMTFTTLLVFCQVLPLIFTIVVIGWRG